MNFEYIYGIKAWDKYPGVTIAIEIITPETAIAMLETNINNRALKREALSQAIENGEWVLSNDMIVFSDDGELINGQNRLTACVKTNIPIVAVVARGFKKEWQIVMDGGIKRTVADFLKMAGYKESVLVAAIGTAMCKADIIGIAPAMQFRKGEELTTKMIVGFIDENYDSRIKPILRDVANVKAKFKGVSSGTLGALFDIFKKADIESYTHYVGMLKGDYQPCKQAMLLMDKLNANAQSQKKLPQRVIGALIIKSWNAYMRGDEIKQLKFTQGGAHPEQFPEIFMGWD